MAALTLQGTEFSFSVLGADASKNGFWAKTETTLKNEYISYREIGETFSKDEIESWIVSAFRLLAGGFVSEYTLAFEKAGLTVDFYPYAAGNKECSREDRRLHDCVMSVHFLMRSSDKKRLLGGVYSLILHRKQIEAFAIALKAEYEKAFAPYEAKTGKYLFVGVSPKGCKGCSYWYLDESKSTKVGDYVWVRMGRRQIEQIVLVDTVRYCDDDTAPIELNRVKRVLRKAIPPAEWEQTSECDK